MPERTVKITLVVDEKGAVHAVKNVGDESGRTEGKFKKLDKEVKGLGKSFGGLRKVIGLGLGALGVSGAALGVKAVVDQTKEALDQTEKLSTISGIGTQKSLFLTAALKARGINAEAAGKAFAFLGSNIKTAERQEDKYSLAQRQAAAKHKLTTAELGKQATAFRQLFGAQGVGALIGLTGEQKLSKVVKAFEALPPAIKKTGAQAALMKEVFGRGGLSLATVLEGGATGLTHFEQVARKFFPQIKGGAKGMEEWQVKNSEFHLGLEGLEFTLGMKMIPALMGVETWFSKTTEEFKAGKGPLKDIARAAEDAFGFFKSLWGVFEKIVGPTHAVKFALEGLVGVMVISKVAGFVGALAGMGPALAVIAPELIPLAAALAGIYALYKHIQEINEFLHPTSYTFQKGPHEFEPGRGKQGKAPLTRAEDLALIAAGAKPGAGPMVKEAAAQARLELPAQPIVIHTHLHADGRQLAETVTKHILHKRARE